MRIRISTLLLIAALVVVVAAWVSDSVWRRQRTVARDTEMLEIVSATKKWTLASNRLRVLRYYRLGPGDFERDVEFHLTSDIFELCRFESEVDIAIEIGQVNTGILENSPHVSASSTAAGLLQELGCKSFNDYYRLFLQRFDSDMHEKFRNVSTKEYKELRDFVEKALASKERDRR